MHILRDWETHARDHKPRAAIAWYNPVKVSTPIFAQHNQPLKECPQQYLWFTRSLGHTKLWIQITERELQTAKTAFRCCEYSQHKRWLLKT